MSDPTPEPDLGTLPGETVSVKPITTPPTFEEELRGLINRHSVENQSNTPDFILVAFISNILIDYAHAVRARDGWYGEEKP